MVFEIRNWKDNSVIFSEEAGSFIKLVEKKVREGANLEGAYLERANLGGANLGRANLGEANLGRADLERADLRGAYLRGANLEGAYLGGADLEGADLEGAYLGGADLEGADLEGAYLGAAYLRGAYLKGANPTVIFSKYTCHLSWRRKTTICIRIGCECRPIDEYDKLKENLADRHDRLWWDKEGQYIFDFLKEEAKRISE